MNVLQNLLSRMGAKPVAEKKNADESVKTTVVPLTAGSFLAYAFGDLAPVTPAQAMAFYRESSSVATAVDTIADEVEYITPVLRGPDGRFIEDSEVLELLKRPNSMEDWGAFVGAFARNYLLTHSAPLYAAGNVNRPPLEMFATGPAYLTVVQSAYDGYPQSYQLTNGPGQGVYVRTEVKGVARFYEGSLRELYRVSGYGSRGPSFPDSPLQAAALEVRQQIQGRYHNLSLLKNGGRLSLIVQFKEDLDQDELENRRDRINDTLAGASNAGRIAAVSSSEMEIHEAGTANKDMDYAVLDQVAGDTIFLRYKVPLPLVRIAAATYDNVRQSTYQLYDRAVIPLAQRMFSGLSMMLLPRYGLDPLKYQITYDPDEIPALVSRRIEELKVRAEIGVETPNELRDLIPGRKPLPGGDVLYQSATLVPMGTDVLADEGAELDGQQ